MRETPWFILMMTIFTFAITINMPTGENEGFLWFYPLYTPTWLQNMFVTGGWVWVYFYVWFMDEFGNKKFNVKVYDFCNNVCMWGYLTHYMFIVIIVRTIDRPYKLSLFWAIVANFVGCCCLITGSYVLLEKLFGLCFKKDKKKDHA